MIKYTAYVVTGFFALCAATDSSGQEIRFGSPVKLAETVNSVYEESGPLLSPDGKILYFVRTGSPQNIGGENGGQDVWYSHWKDGRWSQAKNDLIVNNGDNNAVVGMNNYGEKLFLINNYSAYPRRVRGIVSFEKRDGDWKGPEELELSINMKSDFYGFYISPEEDVLLISMNSKGSAGREDLYVSFRNLDSVWSAPLHMGSAINSEGYEISPFLSDDRKTLYFASNGFGGEGGVDIFKSGRLDDSWQNWSKPENLGADINSSAFDAYFAIYENKAFFVSDREGNGADIYVIGVKEKPLITEELTPEPEKEEIVAGEVEPQDANPAEEPEPFEATYVVYFNFDEDKLSQEGIKTITEVAESIRNHNIRKVIVTGHADNQGPEHYNQHLSDQRAREVAEYLRNEGVSAEIEIKAEGENNPVAPNDNPGERKKNRRAEILIGK